MLTDAHFHPRDLTEAAPGWEDSYSSLGVRGLASSHRLEDFLFNEALRKAGLSLRLSFGVHPQLPLPEEFGHIEDMAREGRLDAIGECGFDAYDEGFKASAAAQEEAFSFQLALAQRRGLPLVVHLRKAMDSLFRHSPALSRLPAVIFHSWPGSPEEGMALLKKGVNAFFSFGAAILNGRKASISSLEALPAERILSETDAPFQPPRTAVKGGPCLPEHLPLILKAISRYRGMAEDEAEALIADNFARALGPGAVHAL